MSHKGNTQITIILTCGPDDVAEGDALFAEHAAWMEQTHYRDGELALLSYNIVKGPELANPLDPGSEPTGNTSFVLTEVYASPAGLEDHWRQGVEWEGFALLQAWAPKCKVTTLHGSEVVQSLW